MASTTKIMNESFDAKTQAERVFIEAIKKKNVITMLANYQVIAGMQPYMISPTVKKALQVVQQVDQSNLSVFFQNLLNLIQNGTQQLSLEIWRGITEYMKGFIEQELTETDINIYTDLMEKALAVQADPTYSATWENLKPKMRQLLAKKLPEEPQPSQPMPSSFGAGWNLHGAFNFFSQQASALKGWVIQYETSTDDDLLDSSPTYGSNS